MATGILLLWLITLCLVTGQEKHYMGGSISFKCETADICKLTIVTGWTVGAGPCGLTCDEQRIGQDTKTSRKEMTTAHGRQFFGKWESTGLSRMDQTTLDQLSGYVSALNKHSGWEQEVAETEVYIGSNTNTISVRLRDLYWREFEFNFVDKTDLHVEFSNEKRNDTGRPNSSPVVIFKPLYRVQLNKETKIHLATADPDDDIVQCSLNQGVRNMQMVSVSKDCSLTVEANELDGFRDEGFGIVNLVVRDFNRHALALAGEERGEGDNRSLSTVTVQFMVQTLTTLDAPSFVPPTRESQHVFVVYQGAVLEIPLYAKLSAVGRTATFNAKSLPRRDLVVKTSQIETIRGDTIIHSAVSWKTGRGDGGVYVFSVSVQDGMGNDGLERSYTVVVKAGQLTMTTGKLKNVSIKAFPKQGSIECLQYTTCTFFVYITHKQTGLKSIANLNETSTTLPWVHVSKPYELQIQTGEPMYQSDIAFSSGVVGVANMCLMAMGDDGTLSDELCMDVRILPSDIFVSTSPTTSSTTSTSSTTPSTTLLETTTQLTTTTSITTTSTTTSPTTTFPTTTASITTTSTTTPTTTTTSTTTPTTTTSQTTTSPTTTTSTTTSPTTTSLTTSSPTTTPTTTTTSTTTPKTTTSPTTTSPTTTTPTTTSPPTTTPTTTSPTTTTLTTSTQTTTSPTTTTLTTTTSTPTPTTTTSPTTTSTTTTTPTTTFSTTTTPTTTSTTTTISTTTTSTSISSTTSTLTSSIRTIKTTATTTTTTPTTSTRASTSTATSTTTKLSTSTPASTSTAASTTTKLSTSTHTPSSTSTSTTTSRPTSTTTPSSPTPTSTITTASGTPKTVNTPTNTIASSTTTTITSTMTASLEITHRRDKTLATTAKSSTDQSRVATTTNSPYMTAILSHQTKLNARSPPSLVHSSTRDRVSMTSMVSTPDTVSTPGVPDCSEVLNPHPSSSCICLSDNKLTQCPFQSFGAVSHQTQDAPDSDGVVTPIVSGVIGMVVGAAAVFLIKKVYGLCTVSSRVDVESLAQVKPEEVKVKVEGKTRPTNPTRGHQGGTRNQRSMERHKPRIGRNLNDL